MRRWLARDAIKPWQHRSWIFPRDPDFEAKAARVLDLYARTWNGVALGDDEYVISADEKSQLQALRRRHPGRPPPGRTRAVEFEYRRGGTLAYLAAYDVHHAHVIGACAPKTGIEPFTELVDQVMTSEPYASARRVFWIVDNGSSHRGRRRSTGSTQPSPPPPWSTCRCTPPGSTRSRSTSPSSNARRSPRTTSPTSTHLAERILAFQDHYNTTARPFDWTFTRTDLRPCSTGPTRPPRPTPRPQHNPRRTNELNH